MTERGTAEQRREHVIGLDPFTVPAVTHHLVKAPVRARVVVEGTVGSVRTVGWAGGPVTEVTLADDTDLITLAFFGDREVGGVRPGSRLVAAGAVVNHHGRRLIMSPQLWLLPTPVPPRPDHRPLGATSVRPPHESLVPALTTSL